MTEAVSGQSSGSHVEGSEADHGGGCDRGVESQQYRDDERRDHQPGQALEDLEDDCRGHRLHLFQRGDELATIVLEVVAVLLAEDSPLDLDRKLVAELERELLGQDYQRHAHHTCKYGRGGEHSGGGGGEAVACSNRQAEQEVPTLGRSSEAREEIDRSRDEESLGPSRRQHHQQ